MMHNKIQLNATGWIIHTRLEGQFNRVVNLTITLITIRENYRIRQDERPVKIITFIFEIGLDPHFKASITYHELT